MGKNPLRLDSPVIRVPVWRHKTGELEINVTKRYGCYSSILKAAQGQMDAMLSRYSRVLVFRLDLHLCEYSGNNEKLSMMMRRFKGWLGDKYGLELVGHLWVREMEKAKSQHYHLVFMLNGHKIRHPSKLISWIERYWEARNEPKPYTPRACYTMVGRNDPETYGKAFYRISYLAKERGKGYKDATANNYSASRIKPLG